MIEITPAAMRHTVVLWLRQGISPGRLALTLALGFAIGCIPVVGIPTVLCTVLAVVLRLNLPAIQAANLAALPLQMALVVPFVRLGRWLVCSAAGHVPAPRVLLHLRDLGLAAQVGSLAGEALLAWLLVAIPAVLLITPVLAAMLRRLPMPAER
jgi:uncharacterized protein (DUF2062 family)